MIGIRDEKLLLLLGKHLRNLRKKAGFSQEQLAYKAGVSLSQISRLERGLLNPTISTLNVLATALDVSLGELVSFE